LDVTLFAHQDGVRDGVELEQKTPNLIARMTKLQKSAYFEKYFFSKVLFSKILLVRSNLCLTN